MEAFAGTVGVVKPQVAFFERHGAAGMAELERLVADASAAGLLVIADAKRGDIDSTAEAYADAWLGAASPLAADAVTAHPYLGLGALAPLVRLAAANGRGVFVVARSSNPEGRDLQRAVTSQGTAVEDMLLAEIAALNNAPDVPAGTVGAVIGATLEPSQFALAQLGGGNSGPRPRRPGCRAEGHRNAVRRVPAGHRVAEQLAGPAARGTRPRRGPPRGRTHSSANWRR